MEETRGVHYKHVSCPGLWRDENKIFTTLERKKIFTILPPIRIPDSFRLHYGPGVDSDSNRNEYQEYFLGDKSGRCVGLTTLPSLFAYCLEIWEPLTPGTLRTCPGLCTDCFTL